MHEGWLAWRRLSQRPGAAAVSIITLATAIGAAAATWTVLSAVLLRPLPVRDPASLFLVAQQPGTGAGAGDPRTRFIYPDYLRVRDAALFDDVAGA